MLPLDPSLINSLGLTFRVMSPKDAKLQLLGNSIIVALLFLSLPLRSALADKSPTSPSDNKPATKTSGPTRRAKGRFLGWKFAHATGQDPSQWTRKNPRWESRAIASRGPSSGVRLQTPDAQADFAYPGFEELASLPTGFIPTAAVAADFNGDGNMDLAISNGGDSTVYVFLGNGDGTFRVPEVLFTQGLSPTWITATALRHNGPIDLVVADGDSNSVEVFLGNGDGTFQQGVQVALTQTPSFLLAGDFNNDGNQDIVVGLVVDNGATEPQFEILTGNGAGGFSGVVQPPPVECIEGPCPIGWVAAADLNNDGFLDLVTTFTGASAIAYVNQSGVSFTQGSPFGPQFGALVVGLGDMDEDGCVDAVEIDNYGLVTIAKGLCDGTFAQSPPVGQLGDLDSAIVVADLDGDGHLDVAGSAAFFDVGGDGEGQEGGYLVSVARGDGAGNLGLAHLYRAKANMFSLVATDFTGDGKPELLAVSSEDNAACLLINDGSGGFAGPQGEAFGYTFGSLNSPIPSSPVLSADLNGDGKPDLVLLQFGMTVASPSVITVLLNDGTGKFLPAIRSPISVGPTFPFVDFILGNFRRLAGPDVIYISKFFEADNVVAFFPNNEDGTFGTPSMLTTLPDPRLLAAGDFNGDGDLDFAVLGTNASATAGSLQIDVFLGHGDGTFTHLAPQLFSIQNAGTPQQLFAFDINRDGKIDLLLGNNDNGGFTANGDDLIEILGNGDGTFRAPATLVAHFGAVAVVDVNHDGIPDLIQGRDPSQDITQSIFYTPAATVYLGTSNGTFVQQPSYDLAGSAIIGMQPLLVSDFDGDGNVDIAVPYYPVEGAPPTGGALLRLLKGAGDGTFTVTNHPFFRPALSDPFVGADFNGDGATDLVELVGYTTSFHTIPAAPAPALDISLNSNLLIGTGGTATVTLDVPPSSPIVVTLAASDPAVQLPPSLTFTSGQQSQTFSFSLGPTFDKTHVLAIFATLATDTAVAYGVTPNPNVPSGISTSIIQAVGENPLQSLTITPGEKFTLLFTLTSESGYSGTFSSFQCTGLPASFTCTISADSLAVNPGATNAVQFTVAASNSTPLGYYTLQLSATDGTVVANASLQVGIGSFSLSVSPATIVSGPSGSSLTTLTSSSTNGLNELLTVTCTGLPPASSCPNSFFSTMGSGIVEITSFQLAPGDYPFTLVGAANVQTQSSPALLRVGDFSAALNSTSATLSPGQSANFSLTLTSLNHYSSSITVQCQSPVNTVSCSVSPIPASLTDGGVTNVQLMVSVTATALATYTPAQRPASHSGLVLLTLLSLFALSTPKRSRRYIAAASAAAIVFLAGCGGGSTGTGINQGNPPPPPQTVRIAVTAQAAQTQADSNNHKNVGTLVITIP